MSINQRILGLQMENDALILKPNQLDQSEEFINLVTSPHYRNRSPLARESREEALLAYETLIKNHELKQLEFWAVWDKEKNKYAGFVGHIPTSVENQLEEMLFAGFHLKYWRTQFPLESMRLAVECAFKKNNITKMIGIIHPEDNATLQCAIQIPSKFEKEVEVLGGSAFLYSVKKEDFLNTKPNHKNKEHH